ncbi:MAG: tryptophan-rich sensory protein [Gammaproteobacteria bacterium]
MSIRRSVLGLAAWLVVTFAAASAGALFQPGDWYAQLQKPTWIPPDGVFAPVWIALYLLMAVSAWLVWRASEWRAATVALGLFLVQLAFNSAWSWLFFGLHRPGWALVDVVLLWFTILAMVAAFWRHSRMAALLLVPYAAWTFFAAVLNLSVWSLNA